MTVEQSSELINELLDVTHPLAENHPLPQNGTQFLRVIEGTFRRNYVRLLSIYNLCKDHPMTPNNALELVRNMVEDVVGIEYMLLRGKEEYAQRFSDYKWVQLYEDMKYAQSLDVTIDESDLTNKDIEDKYAQLPSKLKKSKNWAGRPFEDMLAEIVSQGVLSKKELSVISRLYIEGNRKTHFNPYEINHWMYPESIESGSDRALLMATIFAVTSMVRMTTRYVDEINESSVEPVYLEIAQAAKNILNKYPSKERVDEGA
jgi:hypothetical protein